MYLQNCSFEQKNSWNQEKFMIQIEEVEWKHRDLTHRIWQMRPLCPRSKRNMGEILAFLAQKWCWKVVQKKYFWNSSMRSPFSIKWVHLIERRSFGQKYKFSNKNDMVSAWRNFKNIFSGPLFTIIFGPEMLKFHPYSILTGVAMVGFVIYCVLNLFYPTLKVLEWPLQV